MPVQPQDDPVSAFIKAACVPRDSGHSSGTLDRAEAILAEHPEVAADNIHTAAILGDDVLVRHFLNRDKNNATVKGGPHGWDALTHLCFSKYLRLDHARSNGFVRTATALLDAGANANTGWFEISHQPEPEWESALYGAAGIAHHPELTRLLLERGADPNDGETPYHAAETEDNRALKELLVSGTLNGESLGTLLLRKADWHDYNGLKLLLEFGADPNRMTRWGYTALHQAIRRDNAIENIVLLLDHGADPLLLAKGHSAMAIAARRGRGDLLELFQQRGFPLELREIDQLIAAVARNDATAIHSISAEKPGLADQIVIEGGELLSEFAGNGNVDGIKHLLDLGVKVTAVHREGDGYFNVAQGSMALHVAAWRAQHATVRLLLERGAPVNEPDGKGRTALALAARACVDSHWTHRRSPESVQLLLDAGAELTGVSFPSGYPEVDALLSRKFNRAEDP